MAPPFKGHPEGRESHGKRKEDVEELGEAAKKFNGLFSEKDWKCKLCSNINWARRMTCNQCQSPKPGSGMDANREGYGGGFMERDKVEYRETRFNDDDEYDEFGRKKKKKRKDSSQPENGTTRERGAHSGEPRESNTGAAKPVEQEADDDDGEDDGKWDAWAEVLGDRIADDAPEEAALARVREPSPPSAAPARNDRRRDYPDRNTSRDREDRHSSSGWPETRECEAGRQRWPERNRSRSPVRHGGNRPARIERTYERPYAPRPTERDVDRGHPRRSRSRSPGYYRRR
ncbi:uncharacterized protein EV422DRAFT_526187 [Fimicolochytrium jonesii]|uniref:uncharacterized protein n=1 Tax=Fimicolochytrium jonesii TaxID=1396493 RepID=UPI0022FE077E|nr:uncharacterized protein EV422DRAFT_526187 [Fimicolochytrium jonesii]KAI8822244.1 hypothetical protein EV422DRAFT_526187 [Fimicolochytrium jonesii]